MLRLEHLHDATLVTLTVDWASATLRLDLRTGDPDAPSAQLIAAGLRALTCSRAEPWGPSVSINDVRGPTPLPDASTQRLAIELQSGDTLTIDAERFDLAAAPWTWGTTVRVRRDEPPHHRPGEIAEIVGITEANAHLASKYQVPLGATLVTIEFGDGTDLELPASALEPA